MPPNKDAPKLPTKARIKNEIRNLEKIKPAVGRLTVFGDDNHKAIEAQIHVLQKRLSEEQVYDLRDCGPEEEGWHLDHIFHSALDASRWIAGETGMSAPAEDWKSITK